jgi:hypothetical protein
VVAETGGCVGIGSRSMHLHIVLDKLTISTMPASIFSQAGKSSTKPVEDKSS